MTDPTPVAKLSDIPGAKEALDEALAGLKEEGLPDEWAEGITDAFAEMANLIFESTGVTLEKTLAKTVRRVYEMEAAENDRHAQALDGIPGQHAAASGDGRPIPSQVEGGAQWNLIRPPLKFSPCRSAKTTQAGTPCAAILSR
jgi:hypothetical protein